LFAVMIGFGAVRSVVLLAVGGWAGRPHPYTEIWRATQGLALTLDAAVCVEAFWIVALHFRNVRIFGAALLGLIALIGAGLSYGLVAVWAGWWNTPLTTAAVLVQRVGLALVVTGLLTVAWFRQFPTVPIKPNAIRHLAILTLVFGSFFVSGFFAQSNDHTWLFVANLVIACGMVIPFAIWAVIMVPAGEVLPFPQPPILSTQEFDSADQQDRLATKHASEEARSMHEALQDKRRT
jgi:hypothetical protein